MAEEKKLSNRAKKLLAEIQKDDKLSESNKNPGASFEIYKPSSLKKFSANKYRQFNNGNKLVTWSIYSLIMIVVILFISKLGIGYYHQYLSYKDIEKSILPKLVSDNLAVQKKIKKSQDEMLDLDKIIELESLKIPMSKDTDEILYVISRLFEDANLQIIKQDISINKVPLFVTFSLPPIKNPEIASTIFTPINMSDPSNINQQGGGSKNLGEKISGKSLNKNVKARAKKKLEEKKQKDARLKSDSSVTSVKNSFDSLLNNIRASEMAKNKSITKDLSKNISFISYQFQLKGQYLDYVRVRGRLNRIYPSLRMPVEEIVAQKNTSKLHIRAIYDIPIQ